MLKQLLSALLPKAPELEEGREKRQCTLIGAEGEYTVCAQSKNRFHPSLYEKCPMVSNGKVTRGISYRMTLDEAQMISSKDPDAPDYPYIDITTLNSWLQDTAMTVVSAALFFVTAYSHATFISATFAASSESMGMVLYLTWAMICVIGIDYCIQCCLALRHSSTKWRRDGSLLIQDDDMSLEQVSARQLWVVFLCSAFLALVNVPEKMRVAPIYFHPDKGIRMASVNRIGSHRTHFVGYRTSWEFEVENRPDQFHRTILSLCTGTASTALKALVCLYQKSNWFFIIVNVGVPILMELLKVYDVIKMYRMRQGFRRSLEADMDSPDDVVRKVSRAMLSKHFGVSVPVPAGERQHMSLASSTGSCEAIARELHKKVSDMQFELGMLERGNKLCPGEGQRLVQDISQRLQLACFPCFFEVATPSSINVTPYDFPHDLGPFAMEAIDVKLCMDRSSTPAGTCKTQPIPWTVSLENYPASRVATSCNSGGVLRGTISPLSEVTLDDKHKVAIGIPVNAYWFGWSYPVATKGRLSDNIVVDCKKCTHEKPEDAFLLWGGFVYFNRDEEIVRVLAANHKRQGDKLTGLLGFRPPMTVLNDGPLGATLQEAINTDGGFPLSALYSEDQYAGLRMMWLGSRDIKTEKPSHGGFLLFHSKASP